MKRVLAAALLASLACVAARAQIGYGEKGIYPVYETGGQWAIFDKRPVQGGPFTAGARVLVIGTEGEQVFEVGRSSAAYGGACRRHKPARVKTALLKGPRRVVGRPIIGIAVPAAYKVKGGKARYLSLENQVGDATYAGLTKPLRDAALADAASGKFKVDKPQSEDADGSSAPQKSPEPLTKIDFGAKLAVRGLKDPFVFVEETQIGPSTRRCLRLADGDKLIGECAEMKQDLMAETEMLQLIAYDPSGKGAPYLLALTKTTPKWGDERWGFIVRDTGPKLFLFDAMDPICRAGF